MSAVRELYRQLASALHPDRATSPDDAQRRTELMQRVNTAKKHSDLEVLEALRAEVFDPPPAKAPSLPRAAEIDIWTLRRAVLTDEGWICPP